MKKRLFLLFLACAFSLTFFTGCDYKLSDEDWLSEMYYYVWKSMSYDNSGMKNIDREHKEAFESAFNDIEILGARFCVPMKVSELPDKFELGNTSGSEYTPPSEDSYSVDRGAGLKTYHFDLYYDREINVADVFVVCKEDQSIEEGIIYEFSLGLLCFQPVLLGGQVDINSDISVMKDFLGEGNEFNEISEYSDGNLCTLCYTDGNRMIELSYGIKGDDVNFLLGYIKTYYVL